MRLLPILLLLSSVAHAQIEVPVLVLDGTPAETEARDADLDLGNLVLTATKGQTTVQEAPAIITILTGDELKDRSTRNLEEALDRVPGWMRYTLVQNQFPSVNPRGTVQAVLLLRDGVSMFDSMVNVATVSRVQPLEVVKRLEVVTGPGGVLWGANSFLGVVNLITKDAEDVAGVEASAGYGDGPGDRRVARGYAMTGLTGLGMKLFAHVSFETYDGPSYKTPALLLNSPLPQPVGPDFYGPMTASDPRRSTIFVFDGKLSAGPLTLSWFVPFATRYQSSTFGGAVLREDLAEDDFCDAVDRNDPAAGDPLDGCTDRGHAWRASDLTFFERYGTAELSTRFSAKAGLSVKGYFIQFVRRFGPLAILPPIPQVLEGGVAFTADLSNYRAGGSIDGDLELPGRLRLTYGAEAFHEWLPDRTTASRQGAGVEARLTAPYDTNALPLPCPFQATWDGANPADAQLVSDCPLTFAFAADRTVIGGFASLRWQPHPRLSLDGGARVQAAPASLGNRSYDPVVLGAGALVVQLAQNWHAKLNLTQGFRAPVFNNTDSNAEALQIGGDQNLNVETSTSYQAEVNARLLKGKRQIRELSIRADASYTVLDDFIVVSGGRYANGGRRGITSAELLAKLYLKGNHRLELGYTWLRIDAEDKGRLKTNPEHWFNVGGVVSLVRDRLELNGTLRVVGAFEDPNLRADVRGLAYDPMTGTAAINDPTQSILVNDTDLVLDRLPPSAELQLGLRWQLTRAVTFEAWVANAFNARHYQPDAFGDFQPRLEFLPLPYEDFRFFTRVVLER